MALKKNGYCETFSKLAENGVLGERNQLDQQYESYSPIFPLFHLP